MNNTLVHRRQMQRYPTDFINENKNHFKQKNQSFLPEMLQAAVTFIIRSDQ